MMRNLLALVGAAVVAFAVVGWWLGWYHINTTPGLAGHHSVNIDINAPKIKQDLGKGREKLTNALQRGGQTATPAAPPAPGGQPVPTPAPVGPTAPPTEGGVTVRPAAPGGPVRDSGPESWRSPGE